MVAVEVGLSSEVLVLVAWKTGLGAGRHPSSRDDLRAGLGHYQACLERAPGEPLLGTSRRSWLKL